jgi:CDP-diacylglycerol--glycerol-3-phosphate 3-phosphatidyltransferase
MKLNVANIFSMLRIIISPVFFVLLISGSDTAVIAASILYLIAALTDFFDGWFARKYHEVTLTGKFIDPLADKFLTSFAFIAFSIMGIVPLWMTIIIILRDVMTTTMRVIAGSGQLVIKTSWPAKTKTFIQMVFIAIVIFLLFLLAVVDDNETKAFISSVIFSDITFLVMLGITILTIWTAIEYIMQNKNYFRNIINRNL